MILKQIHQSTLPKSFNVCFLLDARGGAQLKMRKPSTIFAILPGRPFLHIHIA